MIWGLLFVDFLSKYSNMQNSLVTQPQNMQMTHCIHDTWAVGQHRRIKEVASQWMVLLGTAIPIWGLRPKMVKDHVLAVIPPFLKFQFRSI